MHKLTRIKKAAMTRDIELENLETGTLDFCFDDSALVSYDNFEFMEKDENYECKIKLFGEMAKDYGERVLKCNVVSTDILIGKKLFISVLVGEDMYYIYQHKLEHKCNQKEFLFLVSRKDIIQVNNVLHPDLL